MAMRSPSAERPPGAGKDQVRADIRVLVADDQDSYRIVLARLLDREHGIAVVAQASGGRTAVRLAGELLPDVVLMDITMPDLNGCEATREIVARHPRIGVVALTRSDDAVTIERAIRAGACGFLIKDTPVEDVVAAVRAAAVGAAWLAPTAAETVLGRVRRRQDDSTLARHSLQSLSTREREVLRLLAAGLGNMAIAEQLSVSPRTARNHVSHIMLKLGVRNRIQAAVLAVRSGAA
jgi:DNA-binding NarL/FixJ family response regulator